MANLVMGAMPSIIPKLYLLLKEEYNLQAGVKKRISSLTQELELAQAALCKVAEVPWDQLDKQVQIWARKVREASYDMEDVLDTFLVRVEGPHSTEDKKSLRKLLRKMTNFFKKSKVRRKISGDVMDIMTHLQEVTEQCRRYKVDDLVARPAAASTVDPRLHAMYNKVKNLVGIDKSSDELISMLQPPQRGDASNMKMKIVSIVGVGGLGKTTLAKAVYDKLKGHFECGAFVPVGQNPSVEKVLKDILMDLDRERRLQLSTAALDQRQLTNELRSFLEKKRYFIVIDDAWDIPSWGLIKLAIGDDNNCGARIIITTRKTEVALKADEVYKLQPLPDDSSRELFITRIYGHEGKSVDSKPDEITAEFLKKCAGLPLAIITMGSLLVGKPRDKWSEIYKYIGFGFRDNEAAKDTMRILSFSYYDLPAHLRTCLLYLSAFPEDSVINKDSLVWKWVAEGFVHQNGETRLFEIGEGYFNDLINRSMIQAEESNDDGAIIGCRVHDMVLDFIRSISCEEKFFTVLDNNSEENVRRVANHGTIGLPHQTNCRSEKPKLRSFIALECVIETWPSLCTFTYLRVLAIEGGGMFKLRDGRSCVQVEGLRCLPHLRYLSLHGTRIDRIPKEIGHLEFLQTLDLWGSGILELPSSDSLPKQLVRLHVTLEPPQSSSTPSPKSPSTLFDPSGFRNKPRPKAFDGKVFSVKEMTSLEDLTIDVDFHCSTHVEWLVEGLGCLSELRVLKIVGIEWVEEDERDLIESLGNLRKLQSLIIWPGYINSCPTSPSPTWKGKDFLLWDDLQHLEVHGIYFSKLPSCIDPLRHQNLSHLDLMMQHLDEEDLKSLGGLPELYYLSLDLGFLSQIPGRTAIHNISDSDTCYFPKLRCFTLMDSMFSFVANEDDKRVSFHIYYFPKPRWLLIDTLYSMFSDHDELKSDDEMQSPRLSVSHDQLKSNSMAAVSHDELETARHSVSDDESKTARHSVSDDESKIDEETQSPMPSVSRASSPDNENGEDPAAMPSAAPRFMPNLQVLHFSVYDMDVLPNSVYNLGWEHLPSLREIKARLYMRDDIRNIFETELRRAAEVHPNRPTLHM